MGNKPWADEPDYAPIAELVCCLLGGITGFHGLIGWVLVNIKLLSTEWSIGIGAAIGLSFWLLMMYEEYQDRKSKK